MQPSRGFGGSEAPKPRILRWFGGSETVFFLIGRVKPRVLLGFVAFWARKSLSEGLTKLPAATWLQERLGGLWGSMLVHFGVHFELPNRSKNDTENKLIFKRFLGPLEISEPDFVVVI